MMKKKKGETLKPIVFKKNIECQVQSQNLHEIK
jgi:hypothetical protein